MSPRSVLATMQRQFFMRHRCVLCEIQHLYGIDEIPVSSEDGQGKKARFRFFGECIRCNDFMRTAGIHELAGAQV